MQKFEDHNALIKSISIDITFRKFSFSCLRIQRENCYSCFLIFVMWFQRASWIVFSVILSGHDVFDVVYVLWIHVLTSKTIQRENIPRPWAKITKYWRVVNETFQLYQDNQGNWHKKIDPCWHYWVAQGLNAIWPDLIELSKNQFQSKRRQNLEKKKCLKLTLFSHKLF